MQLCACLLDIFLFLFFALYVIVKMGCWTCPRAQVWSTLSVTEQWVQLTGGRGGGTPLITQINKHADELPQWNNGNTTTGSVTSAADTEHNYSSFLPLCLLNIRFFISFYGSLDIFVFYCSYSVFFSLFLSCFSDFSVFSPYVCDPVCLRPLLSPTSNIIRSICRLSEWEDRAQWSVLSC